MVATLAADPAGWSDAADGDLRPDVDPATSARLLFGMVNSLVEWYRPRGGVDAETLADTVATVAFDGLRVRPATVTATYAGTRAQNTCRVGKTWIPIRSTSASALPAFSRSIG